MTFFKILTFKGQKRPFIKIREIGEMGGLQIIELGERYGSQSKKTIRKDWSPTFSERWEPWIRRD